MTFEQRMLNRMSQHDAQAYADGDIDLFGNPVEKPKYPMPCEENGWGCQYCGRPGGH